MPQIESALSAARFYRRIGAHGWTASDYTTVSSSSPALRRWLAARLPGEGAILSIGCGSGEIESEIAAPGRTLVGLDLSPPMLKRARRRGLDCAVAADARALPLADASFDVAMFLESLGHVPLDAVFAEARRVLKKRGRLLLTTYAAHLRVHPRYRKYRFSDILPALADAGLEIEERCYLAAKRNSVAEAASDERATLLYAAAARRD